MDLSFEPPVGYLNARVWMKWRVVGAGGRLERVSEQSGLSCCCFCFVFSFLPRGSLEPLTSPSHFVYSSPDVVNKDCLLQPKSPGIAERSSVGDLDLPFPFPELRRAILNAQQT